jgi:hypothetical protein
MVFSVALYCNRQQDVARIFLRRGKLINGLASTADKKPKIRFLLVS